MKILVTGGGGFLGSHLVRALVDQGHQVTSLSRQKYPLLESLGITQISCDLQDQEGLKKACQGQEVIFHTASKVAMWGKWEDFYQTNAVGTQNLIAAAKNAGVQKFIYTSTPSVVFGDSDLINAPRTTPYPKLEQYQSLYAKSKALAEIEVLKSHHSDFLTIALRPHLIFGPGDKNIIPRLIQRARQGKLKQIGDGKNKVDVIHVKNAVHAHLCALENLSKESPIGGKAYFLGQEHPVVLWDFINRILSHYQIPTISKKISFDRAYQIGAIAEKLFKLFRITSKEPPMTRFVAMQLAKSHYFDHHESHHELGYLPKISLEYCLDDLDPL